MQHMISQMLHFIGISGASARVALATLPAGFLMISLHKTSRVEMKLIHTVWDGRCSVLTETLVTYFFKTVC